MQIRPVLLAVGIMTLLLGLAMIPSALLDISNGQNWAVFTLSAFGSIFIGGCMALLAGRDESNSGGPREAFLLTVLVWVVLPAVAAIPFPVSYTHLTLPTNREV